MKGSLLHVGCGSGPLPDWCLGVTETRLDVDPDVAPDIVANMTDMGNIGPFDVVLCQHALEHLPPHDVGQALSEFRRVLKPGGHAIVFVPDLEGVQATNEVLFESPAGPICGLDLLYGYRPALATMPYMAHRTGFVRQTLLQALTAAGFQTPVVSRLKNYNMMGVGIA
jgi:SAM-dependent methyltransferase